MAQQVKLEIDTMKEQKHPNLLGISYVTNTSTAIFISMPFSLGGDLYDLYHDVKIRYRGKGSDETPDKSAYFHERQILWWIKQIIEGVGQLHKACLVHKDIKTANILINGDMKLVICDFGLAEKVPKGEKVKRGGGTVTTMSPEVSSNPTKPFDCSADWWSVGVVIYQLMYQKSPFDCLTKQPDKEEIKELDIEAKQ